MTKRVRHRISVWQRFLDGLSLTSSCVDCSKPQTAHNATFLKLVAAQYEQDMATLFSLNSDTAPPGVDREALSKFRKRNAGAAFTCRHRNCMHIMQGFSTTKARDTHETSHNPQLFCDVSSCMRGVLSFRCPRDLRAHQMRCHPHSILRNSPRLLVAGKQHHNPTLSGAPPSTENSVGQSATSSVADEFVIDCVCGIAQNDGNTVLCESCKKWQHIECYYSGAKVPDRHQCTDCVLKQHDVSRRDYGSNQLGSQLEPYKRKSRGDPSVHTSPLRTSLANRLQSAQEDNLPSRTSSDVPPILGQPWSAFKDGSRYIEEPQVQPQNALAPSLTMRSLQETPLNEVKFNRDAASLVTQKQPSRPPKFFKSYDSMFFNREETLKRFSQDPIFDFCGAVLRFPSDKLRTRSPTDSLLGSISQRRQEQATPSSWHQVLEASKPPPVTNDHSLPGTAMPRKEPKSDANAPCHQNAETHESSEEDSHVRMEINIQIKRATVDRARQTYDNIFARLRPGSWTDEEIRDWKKARATLDREENEYHSMLKQRDTINSKKSNMFPNDYFLFRDF